MRQTMIKPFDFELCNNLTEMDFVSPIDIQIKQKTEELGKAMANELDNKLFNAVEAVVTVDKDELLKALAYDREQHAKGFKDGYLAGYAAGYEAARAKYDYDYDLPDEDYEDYEDD